MDIRVQTVKFDADKKLEAFITKKVSKLDRFFDGIIAAEVSLSLTADHDNKKVSIRLELPGHDLIVERHRKTFEGGINQCVDALKVQIKKTKEKMRGQ
ncbi:MAG: HPF/RaiA family ribosome-associated protein [Prevotellaceae bacterium]|jgi:putative sigma-54 modulation protein|nr:HPF/RaiA family ribosome-associated protein [Prevotellaceae bacterium]